jgi:hypothetical protein
VKFRRSRTSDGLFKAAEQKRAKPMAKSYSEGTRVEWNWGQGTGSGKVVEIYTSDVTETIKGTEVTRNASSDEPAYLIEQEDGDQVLKSHSELSTQS